jgi:phage gp46-like protein
MEGTIDLRQTSDGGDIAFVDGAAVQCSGLSPAAYLSLFGGNEDDAGGRDTSRQWWGNLIGEDTYRSETQNLLRSMPATSGNLRKVEAAALRDLAWLVSSGAADSVTVAASIPALNALHVDVAVTAEGKQTKYTYSENWAASV